MATQETLCSVNGKCEGDGTCFEQIHGDAYYPMYDYEHQRPCEHDCKLVQCPSCKCGDLFPRCVIDCFDGECVDCAVQGDCIWKGLGEERKRLVRENKEYCFICFGKCFKLDVTIKDGDGDSFRSIWCGDDKVYHKRCYGL